MAKGMTGFGRAVERDKAYEATVEISSVNKRYVDVAVRVPKGCLRMEFAVRGAVAARLHRGQVVVTVSLRSLIPSRAAAVDEGQIALLRTIAESVGVPVPLEKAVFELWCRQLDESQADVPPAVEPLVLQAVGKAIDDLDRRRAEEGAAIEKDMTARLGTLSKLREQIAEQSVGHVDRIRRRLEETVARYVPSLAADDRILREVVLYADKDDVSEELVRIDHHIEQARKALSTDGAIGKLLEFVFQELLREFNTLGAKTNDANVSTAVVVAKTELEKMREQVQNVE